MDIHLERPRMVKKLMRVWSKNLKPGVGIQENTAAQFRETDLKQVLWKRGSWRERPKCLIVLVGRTGVEPVAR